ncbi:MAG: SPOR domain-containing protein [Pseudomonadales bacterium]|nr:SPOR domain-containing protein [Pseudomonadales bacterium]
MNKGFSYRSFLAGIAVAILGMLGISFMPSLDLGILGSSQPNDTPTSPDSSSTRFEFWETLPTNDVAVNSNPYETDKMASAGTKEYLLQAGSFRRQVEAEALRAELILAGMVATTSEVKLVGNDRWFRVLVGPYESPRETRKAMSELRAKKIPALLLERPPRDG